MRIESVFGRVFHIHAVAMTIFPEAIRMSTLRTTLNIVIFRRIASLHPINEAWQRKARKGRSPIFPEEARYCNIIRVREQIRNVELSRSHLFIALGRSIR